MHEIKLDFDMPNKNLQLILGLGATGYSCARFFAQRRIPFAVNDSRANPPLLEKFKQEFPSVKFVGGEFSPELLQEAAQIIISPGISLSNPIIKPHLAKIIGDVEVFAQAVKKPVIGITGSNGKTTVTTLVGEMVKAAGKKVSVCGNIGKPVLTALLEDGDVDFYVVELSSFQLEVTFSLKLATAVLLNVTPDHMDRHGTIEAYLAAKQRIYLHCEKPVVNVDEPWLFENLHLKNPIRISILNDNADWTLKDLDIKKLPLKGAHHYQNDLAALAMGDAVGLPRRTMMQVLENFKGLEHRCQVVREFEGVTWFNDSKGTNVGATQTALNSVGGAISGKVVWIAGGQGKNADFSILRPAISEHVSCAILYGQDAKIIAAAIESAVPVLFATSLEEAVKQAKARAKQQDAVLFSPACASFDMFANFEERGKCYQKIVAAL